MKKRIRESCGGSDPERPDYVMLTERPTLEAIATAVCHAFAVSLSDLRPVSRRQDGSSAARGAFVFLGRQVGGQPLQMIADWIGYRSYAGASKARGRLRAKMIRRPEIRDRVQAAHNELTRASTAAYQGKT